MADVQRADKRMLVESLQQNPVYQALEEHVQRERDQIVDRICAGRCTHDEYVALCGELRGIDSVLRSRPERPGK